MMKRYKSFMDEMRRHTGTKFSIVSQEYLSRIGRMYGVQNPVGMHVDGVANISREYLSHARENDVMGLIAHESEKDHNEIPSISNLLQKLGYATVTKSKHIARHLGHNYNGMKSRLKSISSFAYAPSF